MATSTVSPEATGAITTEKITVRTYVKLKTNTDNEGNSTTVIAEKAVLSGSNAVVTEEGPHKGMPVNWAKAEQDGMTLFAENDVVKYSVKSLDAVDIIVPDPAQRLYIFQTGLASVQNARIAAIAKALKEDSAEPEPLYNQETIDLRVGADEDGSFSFNSRPKRTTKTDREKLIELLRATGTSEAKITAMLAIIDAQTAVADAEEAAA